ncbi:MAG: VWA domain-containing protein [Deltaproteobacteria bacterium]|nr:VWA domain-containing protein [Deltaproteobacteria bacterium]
MRGPRMLILVLAGLLAGGCYMSYPLMDLDDALVDPEADPDLPLEPEGPPPIVDSDGDCITDEDEITYFGTDPFDRDTDGDGLTDWQEVASGTDPLVPGSGLDPMYVVLPYLDAADEHRTVTVHTLLDVADVYFLIDTTGSMDSAIENVARSLATVIVPGLQRRFPDVQMGVGHFNDMPYGGYGDPEDEPFWHVQDITDDITLVQAALNTLYGETPWGYGNDGPESNAVALWAAASGSGFTDCYAHVPRQDSCPAGYTGYPCFRPDVQPVIVHVSDASWHSDHMDRERYDCTEIDFDAALVQMNAINAKHIGVFVNSWSEEGRDSMQEMSRRTGTVDVSGSPLVVTAPTGEVGTGIIDMIGAFAEARYADVSAEAHDAPDDPPGADYDATLFVQDMTPVSGDPPAPEGYSHQDATTFYGVVPGTDLTFDVTFHNDTVAPKHVAQFFNVYIHIVGDTVARIGHRQFVIIVPPEACGP